METDNLAGTTVLRMKKETAALLERISTEAEISVDQIIEDWLEDAKGEALAACDLFHRHHEPVNDE
jgi:hypothetical protein